MSSEDSRPAVRLFSSVEGLNEVKGRSAKTAPALGAGSEELVGDGIEPFTLVVGVVDDPAELVIEWTAAGGEEGTIMLVLACPELHSDTVIGSLRCAGWAATPSTPFFSSEASSERG